MTDLVLCDDHAVFVEVLGAVLGRHGYGVSAIVTAATAIVETVARHRPAVVVIDRHLGEVDGIHIVPDVLSASPASRVLVLTADVDAATVQLALDAGARGVVSKTAGVAALVAAVARVAAGEVVADLPVPDPGPARNDVQRLAAFLTPREWECLALLVEGCGSRAMAQRLGVSTATARGYAQSVLTKLGVHSRLEAASMAVRFSLLGQVV
ncbi:MAG TPA: response regulator transcription factor [Pseudonocardia sp.]